MRIHTTPFLFAILFNIESIALSCSNVISLSLDDSNNSSRHTRKYAIDIDPQSTPLIADDEVINLISDGKFLGPDQKELLFNAFFGDEDGRDYYSLMNETTGEVIEKYIELIENQSQLNDLVQEKFVLEMRYRSKSKYFKSSRNKKWMRILLRHYELQTLMRLHAPKADL